MTAIKEFLHDVGIILFSISAVNGGMPPRAIKGTLDEIWESPDHKDSDAR